MQSFAPRQWPGLSVGKQTFGDAVPGSVVDPRPHSPVQWHLAGLVKAVELLRFGLALAVGKTAGGPDLVVRPKTFAVQKQSFVPVR